MTSTQKIIILILKIRLAILWFAKILAILSCIYFIGKASEYQVQWNLFTWFFPTITSYLNSGISWFGTYILMIPLSIILLSFFITNSITLNIISGFFAILGTLVGIFRNIYTGTLGEIYNLHVVVVTHLASLEKKKEYFILEYERLSIQICEGLDSKLQYIKKYLTEIDWMVYENKLRDLVTLEDVKAYASEVVINLSQNFDRLQDLSKPKKVAFHITDYVTPTSLTIVVGGACLFVFFLWVLGDSSMDTTIKLASLGEHSTEVLNKALQECNALAASISTLADNEEVVAKQMITPIFNVLTVLVKENLEMKQNLLGLTGLLTSTLKKISDLEEFVKNMNINK